MRRKQRYVRCESMCFSSSMKMMNMNADPGPHSPHLTTFSNVSLFQSRVCIYGECMVEDGFLIGTHDFVNPLPT